MTTKIIKSKTKKKINIKHHSKSKNDHYNKKNNSVIRQMKTIFKTKMCNLQKTINIHTQILIKIVVDENETKRFMNDVKILKKEL